MAGSAGLRRVAEVHVARAEDAREVVGPPVEREERTDQRHHQHRDGDGPTHEVERTEGLELAAHRTHIARMAEFL
jgi:hypothetical protein